ncbi:hypothetical protein K7X08_016542 [Anisodus acutangulus]|uniref:Cyanobacterial aminoacyl-tRNA synthetase CAAD domain-containing protein n=1 Tax=Anisodus acutangulus TaxID=402998 RepID=A0A9Q1R274_9SOLA|nr:hypothetical protein K7X08_016542 [Anisodus acutangulus]
MAATPLFTTHFPLKASSFSCSALPYLPHPFPLPTNFPESKRSSLLQVKASSSEETSIDTSEFLTELKEKSTVLLYGGGAIIAIWLSSIVVDAINSVPLLPKVLELVGLGYTGWFVYRYLLFKSSRKELAEDVEELKKKIAGTE